MLSKVFQVIYFIIDFLLLGLKKKGANNEVRMFAYVIKFFRLFLEITRLMLGC